MFAIVVSFKLVTIFYKIIFEQTSFDIFLVDWEKPKPRKGTQEVGVNAWRALFLLNELNELQCEKLISIEFTLLAYAFFMEGIGWRWLSTYDPTLQVKDFNSPENFVINFFVTAIVMYVIGSLQYLL